MAASDVIETHEHKGDSKSDEIFLVLGGELPVTPHIAIEAAKKHRPY